MINMRKYLKTNYPSWILGNFPSHLIDQAFIEAFTRFNTCINQCKKYGTIFEFKYKTKKAIIQSINLEKYMLHPLSNSIFYNWKIDGIYTFRNLRTSENFHKKVIGSSISYHKVLGTFTLNMNYNDISVINNCKKVCGVDQGVKTPFVVYSNSNVTEIGTGCAIKLHKICKEIDIIKSRMNKNVYYKKININGKQYKEYYHVTSDVKRNLRKAMHRKIQYVKNLRIELHNKTVKYLCDTFKTIILPPFEIQEMACNLTSSVARKMYTLSFYKFKEKLLAKANEKNVKVYSLTEPYTSKTCGRCGNIKHNLGNADIYNCINCNLVISRDVNGARNILLRNIHLV